MAYYLGRDLEIALTTENASFGVGVTKASSVFTAIVHSFYSGSASAATTYLSATHRNTLLAGPLKQTSSTVFGTMSATVNSQSAQLWDNTPDNIVSVDLSVSTMDEDVQFIGQRNVLKAEVKKENSITITRKKKDNVWNAVYDDARLALSLIHI